jgi:uncharacterized glyoxalase superfamily protein PhnB
MAPHPIQPHLVVNNGQKAIAWYKDTWGATQEMLQLAEDGKPADMFWGAYYGRLIDPFGHSWSMGSQ